MSRIHNGEFSVGIRYADAKRPDGVVIGDIKTLTGRELLAFAGAPVEPEAALMILARKMARDIIGLAAELPE